VDRFAYILRRLVQAIPVLFGVTLIVFFMIHLVPGDPARTMLGVHATPSRVAALHREWGLDRSVPEQYWLYLKRLLHGNLGTSLFYRVSTASLIRGRLPVTLWLIAYGTLLSIVIALPLATLAATRKDKAADQAVRAVPLVGLGFPPFWLGIMLLLAFGLHLGRLFPVGGYGNGFFGHLHSMILPAITIAVFLAPILIRSLRASLLDILQSDYITTARSKRTPSARQSRNCSTQLAST